MTAIKLGSSSTCPNVLKHALAVEGNLVEQISKGTTIVTGANSGIGKITAKHIAFLGGDVVLACRNTEKAIKAIEDIKKAYKPESEDGKIDLKLHAMSLDLGKLSSVVEFAAKLKEAVSKGEMAPIRLIVLNAGMMPLSFKKTENGFDPSFQVNHLGHFLMMRQLIDAASDVDIFMEKRVRVVAVSSMVHSSKGITSKHTDEKEVLHKVANVPQEGMKKHKPSMMALYSTTKLFNLFFTNSLSEKDETEVNGIKITAASVHPGFVKTEIMNDKWWGPVAMALAGLFAKSPEQGASTSFYCAVMPDETVSGKYFSDCKEKRPGKNSLGEGGKKSRDAIWNLSEKLCVEFLTEKSSDEDHEGTETEKGDE